MCDESTTSWMIQLWTLLSLSLSLCTQTHPLPNTAKWLATMLPWWCGQEICRRCRVNETNETNENTCLSSVSPWWREKTTVAMKRLRRASQSAGRLRSGVAASSSDPQPSSQLNAGMCFANESQCCCNLGLRAVWVFLIHSVADGDSHVTTESVAPSHRL